MPFQHVASATALVCVTMIIQVKGGDNNASFPSSLSPSSNSVSQQTAVEGFQVINILTYVFLCSVMFGIGAGVRLNSLKSVITQRKSAFAVGLLSQYLVVPAAARFVTSVVLQMPDLDGFVVVLIGCCPGGAVSNAMTYWSKGDLALSVAMTVVSNTLAFATLPLLLLIWTQGYEGMAATVPYLEIFYSLLMVLVPASIGIMLRRHNDIWANRAEKIGAAGGLFLIAASIVAGLASNVSTLGNQTLFPWKNIVSVFLVAPIGMMFAFFAISGLQNMQRKGWCLSKDYTAEATEATNVDPENGAIDGVSNTNATDDGIVPLPSVATIVIETGVQNTVLAMAIMTLSFSSTANASDYLRMQLLIVLWGIVVSFEASVAVCVFRYFITQKGENDRSNNGGGAINATNKNEENAVEIA
jgi:predicted Na+-dependent transporter